MFKNVPSVMAGSESEHAVGHPACKVPHKRASAVAIFIINWCYGCFEEQVTCNVY